LGTRTNNNFTEHVIRRKEKFAMNPQPLLQRITSDAILDQAHAWLAEQQTALPHWAQLKPQLQDRLQRGEYCFQPLTLQPRTNRLGEQEMLEVWEAQDRLVLKAISLVLKDHFKDDLSTCCHHLEGRGGIKKAVRRTRDYLQGNPDSWVLKTDVKGYYAHIDHHILHQQLADLLPQEKYLLRLLWQYLQRTVYEDGDYRDIERGISLGSPLSPLMAALYLQPLDDAMHDSGLFYARFMDDYVALAPTRWALRHALQQ
jgi:retron-type reverse transcriptase